VLSIVVMVVVLRLLWANLPKIGGSIFWVAGDRAGSRLGGHPDSRPENPAVRITGTRPGTA
jgi:hypothetical protein